jgi:peptidoglycan/LPS O-acetylase OafA/YrhL
VFVPERWLVERRRLWSWLGGIGLIALVASAELIGTSFISASMFPGFVAAIPMVATLLLLLAGVGAADSFTPRLLSTRPAQAMGRLS